MSYDTYCKVTLYCIVTVKCGLLQIHIYLCKVGFQEASIPYIGYSDQCPLLQAEKLILCYDNFAL